MPVEGPLPGTGDQHDINADAIRCFNARTPRNWRLQSLEGTDDYGYDYQVQTTPDQQATDIFRVQLKGTCSPNITADGEFISITLKASTVRYYDRAVEPVLLVVCDLSFDPEPVDCPLYYVWTRDELNRINVAELPVDQNYVTLRVPTKNRLRSTTDLSNDIRHQNELSRAGHDLSRSTEQTHPWMQADDRLTLVQGVVQGLAAKGPALLDALASSEDEYWVNPPQGSLAWSLSQARAELRVNALRQAATQLDEAEAKLENCTDLELAEYWGLRGNWHVQARANQAAVSAYKKAYQAKSLPKYVAAWVEAEIRIRLESGNRSLSDLHDQLEGDDPVIVATRSRLNATQGDYDLALDAAEALPEPDRSFVKAYTHWLSDDPANTVKGCETGLTFCDRSHTTHSLLLLLRARAKFALTFATAGAERENFIPPAGLPGVDVHVLEDAWLAINDAVAPLKAAGWDSNIELIVDIWAATASALGKGEAILQDLIEATRTRPDLPNIHVALRSMAGQLSNYQLALSANECLPESEDKNIWATILLHGVRKFRLCWQHFKSCVDSIDRNHPMFGAAVTAAILSAHESVQPELVKQWMGLLDAHPHLNDQAAIAQFYLALEISRLAKDEALASLISRYEELNHPLIIALTLFQEINPTDLKYAPICVTLSERITEYQLLSPSMAAHLGLALVTLEDWQALLELCTGNSVRVEPGDRMVAFEALALDHLGETEKARDRLLSIVASGSYDQLALNTYVTIAARCGYLEDAVEAAERVLETVKSKHERFECIKLLYALTQFTDPQSGRLLDLALRAGDLADQEIESQEGTYLVMHLSASIAGNDLDLARDREQFRIRSDAFFRKFPNSRMLRKSEIREDSSAEELMESLRAITGITRDQEAFQSRLEHGLQQGFTIIPFSWRPRRALSLIRDVVHLWEVAKKSSRDDRKYHLTMIAEADWKPVGEEAIRQRIPLLDWTSLLVLYDLDLIETAVKFFGQIAIPKAVLEELAEFTNPFFGSLYQERCLGVQKALKPHLASILQPSPSSDVRDSYSLGRSNTQIVEVCAKEAEKFRLYSDDYAYRVFCAGQSEVDGFCTLDLLAALVEVGMLTPLEKARKMARLCEWRVGVVVQLLDLLLLLPQSLQSARSVSLGVQILDAEPELVSVFSALWDYRLPFDHALNHAAKVLRVLLGQPSVSDIGVTSLLRQWHVKASLKKDAPPDSLQTITLLILFTAMAGDLPSPHVRRLWSIFIALVEAHHGNRMDEALEREAIQLLGRQCAELEAIEAGAGEVVYGVFNEFLTQGTTDREIFSAAYTSARIAAQSEGARR